MLRYFFTSIFHPFKAIKTSLTFNQKFTFLGLALLVNYSILLLSVLLNYNFSPPLVSAVSENNISWLFIFPVLIGPLREEILFRLWLVYSRFNLSCFLGVFTLTVYLLIQKQNLISNWHQTAIAFVLGFTIFFIAFLFLRRYDNGFRKWFSNHNRKLTIFSIIAFGYFHLFNFEISTDIILYSPLLLLSYFISGYILCSIRFVIGFKYALLLHIIINVIPSILFLVI